MLNVPPINQENVENIRRKTMLLEAFAAVERFNACAGGEPTIETLFNKLLRVREEVEEGLRELSVVVLSELDEETMETKEIRMLRPLEEINKKEVLDAVDDVLYTSLGIIKPAENIGMNVFGGLSVVCENNDTKLIDTIEHANETAVMYEEQNIPVDIRYNAEYDKFVVVNKSEQKVLKPKGYKRVELGEFVKGE